MRKKKVLKKTVKKKTLPKRPPKAKKPVVKEPKSKYLKVPITESRARFVEIGEMIQNKELKWISFGMENNIGTHFYLILKTQKR